MIVERAKMLLLAPRDAWLLIASENDDAKNIINYAATLALVPAAALLLGYWLVGLPVAYGYFRMTLISAFFSALIFYFFAALAIALTAMMIGFFCSYFSIEGRWETFFKLAAYSATAPLLANAFYLVPVLKFLKILGFYGCVTLFTGLPLLLKIPKEKEMQFVVTVIIGAVVISLIFSGLTDQFLGPIYSDIL
jgi:hypothetical protein